MHRRRWLAALGILALIACGSLALRRASPPAVRSPAPPMLDRVVIDGVPHEKQKPDFCGEACIAMWLAKLRQPADQDLIFEQTGVDPALGRGAYAAELARALERFGFQIGRGFYPVMGSHPQTQAQLEERFADLHRDLLRGIPSIVCMHYDESPESSEHFRLILGYDPTKDEVVYHEPAEADGAYRRMARPRFLSLWPLKSDAHDWTVVRFRLAQDGKSRDVVNAPTGRRSADYAQHILALKRRLPEGFSLALAPPFVVVGDGGADAVQGYAQGSIAWAVQRLKQSYFSQDPEAIIDIWLFKDADSYRQNLKRLFDEEPSTPYGYYSERHQALFMNIATGGGTLVHEIVHPYLHANFPDVPAWFNEGLGSLYEQCDEADGKIVGLTNWRLSGLQAHIREHTVPSFASLTSASDQAFYRGPHRSTGYGQARYLLYYLQQHGLLEAYYRRFLQSRRIDPTGYRTLMQVLGETDMAAFQARWEQWVLQLVFEDSDG